MYATLNSPTVKPEIKKYGEAVLHISIWLFFYAEKWINNWAHLAWETKIMLTFSGLSFPAMFYLNAFWLIPAFLRKGRLLQYCLYLLVSLLFLALFSAFMLALTSSSGNPDAALGTEFQRWFFRQFRLSGTALGLFLSFAYRFSKDWIYYEREKEQLVAEKSQTELAYLKSQLNPHFLFNTLNNLYAVALEEKSERTAEGIARLGSLMRYSLHDSQADFILLSREIDYIERYIELQRLRINERNEVNIRFKSKGEVRLEKIAPMLLLPLIENAFKYGMSPVKAVDILVEVKVESGVLDFTVINAIVNETNPMESTGLGLANVKKRLEHLYRNKYHLSCQKLEDTYKVELNINLNQ